jgi:hypothetical protein
LQIQLLQQRLDLEERADCTADFSRCLWQFVHEAVKRFRKGTGDGGQFDGLKGGDAFGHGEEVWKTN